MKVTATETINPGKPEYPYFGKSSSTGAIVLFSGSSCGTVVVATDKSVAAGHHSDNWVERMFTPFYGTITVEP